MKKIITILMSLMLIFSLAACGNNQQSQSDTAESVSEMVNGDVSEFKNSERRAGTDEEQQAEESEEGMIGDGKVLVVYYSATGNTKEVANFIAAATNADTFELEPANPYSDRDLDWTDENSRVVYEHDNPDARDVELVLATPAEWESYDTVFIGFPIWLAYHNLIQCTQA